MFTNIDTRLFYLINKNCSNPMLDLILPYITFLGSEEVIFTVSVIIFFFRDRKKRIAALTLLAGLIFSYIAVSFLKDWFAMPRPYSVLPDVHLLTQASGYSFPSGHAAFVFMAAPILSRVFKRHLIFYSLAALICFSRIYLGAHFPSDVAAGSVLGMIIGYILVYAVGEKNKIVS